MFAPDPVSCLEGRIGDTDDWRPGKRMNITVRLWVLIWQSKESASEWFFNIQGRSSG